MTHFNRLPDLSILTTAAEPVSGLLLRWLPPFGYAPASVFDRAVCSITLALARIPYSCCHCRYADSTEASLQVRWQTPTR
jgi:hypothetical protein